MVGDRATSENLAVLPTLIWERYATFVSGLEVSLPPGSRDPAPSQLRISLPPARTRSGTTLASPARTRSAKQAKREAFALALTPENISTVSNFAQPGGTGSAFNKYS